MNSLEALENLYEFALSSEPMELTIKDFKDIILKDLDILKTIKANKDIIFSKRPNYEDMKADDFFKISRWLENE